MSDDSTEQTAALTPKQELFCQEYLKDLNGTQAAIRAGYSENTANEQAARLLAKVSVRARVEQLKADRIKRVQVEQDDVLSELLLVLKSSVAHYTFDEVGRVTLKEGAPDEALRAVSRVKRRTKRYLEGKGDDAEPVEVEEVEYALWDKPKAIELSMKHLGLVHDRLRIEDPDDVLSKVLGVKKEELP